MVGRDRHDRVCPSLVSLYSWWGPCRVLYFGKGGPHRHTEGSIITINRPHNNSIKFRATTTTRCQNLRLGWAGLLRWAYPFPHDLICWPVCLTRTQQFVNEDGGIGWLPRPAGRSEFMPDIWKGRRSEGERRPATPNRAFGAGCCCVSGVFFPPPAVGFGMTCLCDL